MIEYKENNFAVFFGCTIPIQFPFIESSSRKIMKELDFKIKELPFGCCPDPNGVQSFDKDTWFALAAWNLCLAEEEDLDILTFCNGCYETLKVVNEELQHNDKLFLKINKILAKVGKEYIGKSRIYHIVQELYDRRIEISNMVTQPLDKYHFAVHYGCHLLRPAETLHTDDSEHPVILDELVRILKGNSVPYLKKRLCCGAGVYSTELITSEKIIREKLVEINKVKADAIVLCCPTCYRQYEAGQALIKRDYRENYGRNGKGIPVIYYTELLAYALGVDMSEEFNQHRIKLPFV